MPDYNKLSVYVNQLKSLLDDRQEGLLTWHIAVNRSWEKIVKIWSDEPEEKGKGYDRT